MNALRAQSVPHIMPGVAEQLGMVPLVATPVVPPGGYAGGQVLIAGAWKTVAAEYVCVGGTWKTVTLKQVCVGGVWKTLV